MIASLSEGGEHGRDRDSGRRLEFAPERATAGPPPIPFDAGRLDALMEEAGIDALVVTSKHNIQYLLGGYRFFFFDHFDAIGVSRYLPVLVYVKGHPERADLCRTSDGELRAGAQPVLGPDIQRFRAHEHRRDRGRDRKARDACAERQKDRRRAGFPSGRRRGRASQRDCPKWSSSKRSCPSNAFARSRRHRNWKTYERRAISWSIRCSRSSAARDPA